MWALMVIRTRAEAFRARSIGLSLVGLRPVLSKGGNSIA